MMSQHALGAQRLMAALLLLAAATQMRATAGYATSADSSPCSRSYSPHSRRYSPHRSYPASPPSDPPTEPPSEALTAVSPADSVGELPTSASSEDIPPDVPSGPPAESSLLITPEVLYGQPALPASASLGLQALIGLGSAFLLEHTRAQWHVVYARVCCVQNRRVRHSAASWIGLSAHSLLAASIKAALQPRQLFGPTAPCLLRAQSQRCHHPEAFTAVHASVRSRLYGSL